MRKPMFLGFLIALSFSMALSSSTAPQSATLPTLSLKGEWEINRLFTDAVAKKEIPGLVAAVVNKDRILYLKAFGKQDVGKNIPMAGDSMFRIASMTKPVTSVAIMMQVEQGALRLDEPASKFLPALKGREVLASYNESDGAYSTQPARREITIRHLLNHTAGFGYSFSNRTLTVLEKKTGKSPDDLPLLFDPGSKWEYSDSPAFLGEILKTLSGQSLEDHFRDKIFRPLQMSDTAFFPPAEKLSRVTTIHQRCPTGLMETANPAKYRGEESGEGGLVSTASDYAAFLRMLLNQGSFRDARILKAETVRQMISNQIGRATIREMVTTDSALSANFPFGVGKDKFGLGFQIAMTEGRARFERSAGSYAWAGLFNTHFWVDPRRGVGVIFLSQELPFYNETLMNLLRRFEHLIYANLQLT